MNLVRRMRRTLAAVSLGLMLVAGPAAMFAPSAMADHAELGEQARGELERAAGEEVAIEPPNKYVIIATLVNFFIFAFIVAKFGGPAFNRAMAERRETILKDMEEAARLRKEAEAELAVYIEKLEAFDRERETLLAAFRTLGERERDQLIEDAKHEAARIVEDAERMADREASHAERGLEARLIDRAMELATADIERQVNPMVQNRLVERSIDSFKSLKAS